MIGLAWQRTCNVVPFAASHLPEEGCLSYKAAQFELYVTANVYLLVGVIEACEAGVQTKSLLRLLLLVLPAG